MNTLSTVDASLSCQLIIFDFLATQSTTMKLFVLRASLLVSAAVASHVLQQNLVDNDDKPDACVSLFVHPDTRCREDPLKIVTFPTWTKPGSACYTNDQLIVSVKDQYCSAETGNWHQTLYPKDGDCGEVPWWLSWIFPQEQVFTPDGCIPGFGENGAVGLSLNTCSAGPCDGDVASLDDEGALFAFFRSLRA